MLIGAEILFLDFLQEYVKNDFLDWLMVRITTLGNGGFIWILICFFLILSRKYRKMGIVLLMGLLTSFIMGNLVLKPLIARARPSWGEGLLQLLIDNPTDYSFPSGHTLSSFISAYIITYYKRKAGFIVFPLAILIAFSRLYLYVHYPTDVLGGIVLGILLGFVVAKLGDRILK